MPVCDVRRHLGQFIHRAIMQDAIANFWMAHDHLTLLRREDALLEQDVVGNPDFAFSRQAEFT